MRVLMILSLMLLGGCGARSTAFIMGQTTKADVVAEKGDQFTELKIPVKDGSIMKFKDNETIQLKGDIVTNRFTNPSGDQKLLIWWKHKFKDCVTTSQKLPHDPKAHTPPEIEFSCPSEGMSVVYTEGSDFISRVVENEKK